MRTRFIWTVLLMLSAIIAFAQEPDSHVETYRQHEMQVEPMEAIALNLLLGLGIGSFHQGDDNSACSWRAASWWASDWSSRGLLRAAMFQEAAANWRSEGCS